MDTPTPPKTTSFSHRVATLSWVCPIITIIIFVLLIFGRQIVARKAIALVASSALWLLVIGLILGIVALFGISKHGTKGILGPAIVGIIINGLLISFVVTNFITSRARAMQQHGAIDASPVRVVWSNKSLQATRDGGFRRRSRLHCVTTRQDAMARQASSASRFTSFGPACLSSGR
jgi:hypothetical protein